MANTLYVAPIANFVQTTLNGAITSSATSITLTSTTNMQSPGYVVIDRTDSAGTATPNAREVIFYTGISGASITGVTRGADNSTARTHSDGAVVETTFTVGMYNSLATIVATAMTTDGYLLPLASPASIAIGRFIQITNSSIASTAREEVREFVSTSAASIAFSYIATRLDVSGASVTGLGISPVFIGSGFYSGPTTAIGGLLIAPRPATLRWVSAITKFVVSGASVGFDFQVRGASIFSNATTRPSIAAGGTFVSTASIATVNINAGDVLQADVASVGAAGIVQQITISGGTN